MIGRLRCPDVFEPTRAGTGGQRSLRPLSPRSRFRDRLLSGSWHAKTTAIQHEIGFPPKILPTDSGEEAIFGEGSNSVTVGVAITGIDSDSFVTEGSAGPIRHSARQTTMNTGRNRAMVGLVTAHPLRSRCRRFCNATHKSGTTTTSHWHAACIYSVVACNGRPLAFGTNARGRNREEIQVRGRSGERGKSAVIGIAIRIRS